MKDYILSSILNQILKQFGIYYENSLLKIHYRPNVFQVDRKGRCRVYDSVLIITTHGPILVLSEALSVHCGGITAR